MEHRSIEKKDFYSTIEAAKMLGISRIAVFKKIKEGKIRAEKIGRNYAISYESILEALNFVLSDKRKEAINKTVHRATKEYGEVFRMLEKE